MKNLKKNQLMNENHTRILFLIALFSFTFLFSFSQSESEDKTLSPYFYVVSNDPETDDLPLKSTSAEVNIVGVIADVSIKQVYKNEGKSTIEAIYTFPASSKAAVYSMEMKIGSRKIVAQIKEKEKARAEYEEAKNSGQSASLLEQQRPNVFQMNVANIRPGETIEVSMKYTEMLVPEAGTYSFVYPTVVGPRYTAGAAAEDTYLNTPYQKEGETPFSSFDLNVYLAAGMPIDNISCTTHKTNITYPQSDMAEIKLDQSEKNGGNRDFILEYSLGGDKIQSGLLLYEHGDENFFMMMVEPPKKVLNEDIPPREYIFIVDVSGSMTGFPLTVSKKLMRNLVTNLRSTDKFNVMVFAGSSGFLSETSLNATSANIEQAISYIENQKGGGGTNLLPALEKALTFPRGTESLSRSFVIITDGYVDVEKKAFDLIRNNCDNANTFIFGIGSSVNRYIIEGIAHVGMSEPFVVTNSENCDNIAEKFRKYINSPVLTQIKRTITGIDAYDMEPTTIPDVMAERPVIIYGKYRNNADGSITLKGHAGKEKFKKTIKFSEAKPDKRNSAIRYLWARERIKMLDDYNNANYDETTVKEVTGLGLKYNLMTAYTSFVAIDEQKVTVNGNTKTVKQALPMPQGVSNYAIGFEMELDEAEMGFSLYSDIEIITAIDEKIKNKVIEAIEKEFIADINSCFNNDNSLLEKIEITVDEKGNITGVSIIGPFISIPIALCLKDKISKWDFSEYQAGCVWTIQIKF
ncbi:MAG: hypothetical protein A2W91_11230 [Bacteroidetes bacterium GWF2_38_335]|nr:MAG: hypothetical protein A2W91_11230 [Bacteroidetes bacterium GWF2_38_335]HBS87795.1 trypsin [Bacteroidales bacterium]